MGEASGLPSIKQNTCKMYTASVGSVVAKLKCVPLIFNLDYLQRYNS